MHQPKQNDFSPSEKFKQQGTVLDSRRCSFRHAVRDYFLKCFETTVFNLVFTKVFNASSKKHQS